MSRPSDYTEHLADEICDRIAAGESLRKICETEGFPHRITVIRWLAAHESFATKCARARLMQADLMDDKILDAAEDCDEENYQSTKVKISAYQWRASKLAPKIYGDRTVLAGDKDAPLGVQLIHSVPQPDRGEK
jgi:hypothetical protein